MEATEARGAPKVVLAEDPWSLIQEVPFWVLAPAGVPPKPENAGLALVHFVEAFLQSEAVR